MQAIRSDQKKTLVARGPSTYGSRRSPGRRKEKPRRSVSLQPQLLLALAERAQPQGVELDEARGVTMIVGDRAFLEGDEILIVQRILALAPDHDDVALVEFEAHAAGDIGLAVIDRRLQHLALRREPEAG